MKKVCNYYTKWKLEVFWIWIWIWRKVLILSLCNYYTP